MQGNKFSIALLVGIVGASTLAIGCSSDSLDLNVSDNEGSKLTTTPGQAITEQMVLGKWDLDGERTNDANKAGGTTAIADDVLKDVLGAGWKFESGGVLKIDAAGGYKTGSYSIAGSKLTIKDHAGKTTVYDASFKDGYLYLKDPTGKYRVMEKGKFFNF